MGIFRDEIQKINFVIAQFQIIGFDTKGKTKKYSKYELFIFSGSLEKTSPSRDLLKKRRKIFTFLEIFEPL